MRKVTPITEQFQHFVQDLKETFWGDVYGKTRGLWKRFLEEQSELQQSAYLGLRRHERAEDERKD